MSRAAMYFPENGRTKHPVVIAFPGLVDCSEETRADHILKRLAGRGIAGIVWTYSHPRCEYEKRAGQTPKLTRISFPIDLELALHNITAALEFVREHARADHYDQNSIGVITNSISSGLLGKLLAKYVIRHHEIKAHVAISPLPGWNQFANAERRRKILESETELDISSEHDKRQGVVRVIPYESVRKLTHMDSLTKLQRLNENIKLMGEQNDIHLPAQLTIVGKRDKTSSLEGMKEYHELMGGKEKDFIILDSEHDLPEEPTNSTTEDFLAKHLLHKKH